MSEKESEFSQNVARLRRDRGLTQEELGNAVNVSVQAVSRWEHGGMPDVSLLPGIADALHVSIDELFGHQKEPFGDIAELLDEDLRATPEAGRFERMFTYCWSMLKSITGAFPSSGTALVPIVSGLENVERRGVLPVPPAYHLTFDTDQGMLLSACARDLRYMFLMPEPEYGYMSAMKHKAEYLKLFSMLCRPHRLDMLLFLHGENRDGFSPALAARELGISVREAEEILEELYVLEFVRKTSYNTTEGRVTVYIPFPQITLIPFLFFAGQLMVSCGTTESLILMRTRPFCDKALGEDAVLPNWITRDQEFTRDIPEGVYGKPD